MDENLHILPIADKLIKDLRGRVVNCVNLGKFSLGKELQTHVAEFKTNTPFRSPRTFEETMHGAVLKVSDFLERRYRARLLGLGMHPFLELGDAKVWPHRDRQIYRALSKIFNINQHGWLNIQSFQLNLSYSGEDRAMKLHNALANILPYIPAISASSPIYESKIGGCADNRLHFYQINQKEVPSITGDVVPEYVRSFEEYRKTTIQRYSLDLTRFNAPKSILFKEWMNSRGAIFRFDRKAIEIRIMDEQECIKSDVALSCFIRALLRGLLRKSKNRLPHLPHDVLVNDLSAVIKSGLDAQVRHPAGSTAREVCCHLYRIAEESASPEERRYLWIIKRRIEEGNLSNLVLRAVAKKAQRTDLEEAILNVYSSLTENLRENKVYI